jgi:hypothetical protein
MAKAEEYAQAHFRDNQKQNGGNQQTEKDSSQARMSFGISWDRV